MKACHIYEAISFLNQYYTMYLIFMLLVRHATFK